MERSSDAISSQVAVRRVALLSCGTFSPPTYMHLRMFERARDYLEKIHGCEVVEGIMSPVADSLGRPDMVPAKHRLKMVQLAVKSSSWIRADGWECSQGEWTRTIHVLHHFKEALSHKYGNGYRGVRLLLLCGGDVIEGITKLAVSDVMLWNTKQIEEVVRDFGIVVVMRANTDPIKAIYLADVLRAHQKNIYVIEDETCPNDVSSTRLRTAIRRKESIRYCTNDEVIQYIEDNSLYKVATSPPAMRIKLHNVCKSASSSNIPTSSAIVSVESCLKHAKSSLPPKHTTATAEEIHHKQLRAHFPEDEKHSCIMETSPIWCPSTSLPDRSSLVGELVSAAHSLPQLRKTLPILTPDEQCSAEINVDKAAPKRCKHTRFRSTESPDYDNLTLDELLAASTGWVDYLGSKKDELYRCAQETEGLTTSQAINAQSKELSLLQMKMPTPMEAKNLKIPNSEEDNKRKKCEVHSERPSAGAVSRSAENLTEEPPLEKESKSRSLFHIRSEEAASEGSNVTLIYRKYKLASTPETTV